MVQIRCEWCSEKAERHLSRVLKSTRLGHSIYCGSACAKEAKKAGAKKLSSASSPTKAIQESLEYSANENWNQGKSSYRKRALRFYGAACTVCGYSEKSVIQVHHKDHNRSNNRITNLDVLCPTHHVEYHKGIRRYRDIAIKDE